MTYQRAIANFEALKANMVAACEDVKVRRQLEHIASLSLYEVIQTQEQADIFMKSLLAAKPKP
jgi:hypothetical protein